MRSKEIEEYKKKLKLSKFQKEILFGIMLGDGHLESRNSGNTYRLKIEQSIGHEAYVWHLYEVFKDWVRTAPQEKVKHSSGSQSTNLWFQTYSHGAFRFFAQQFYSGKKKVLPKLLHRYLTPVGLAYWYMDDGSMKSAYSRGLIFNTQSFMFSEVETMCKVLSEKFGLQAKPRKQREGYQVYVSGHSFELFLELVSPNIIDEMQYKIPTTRL